MPLSAISPVELLETHDWHSAIIKLSAYAVSQCLYRKVKLPAGREPEDLAMEAIEKVYRGERTWDPEQDPDLTAYLKSVIKSLISNAATSAEGTTRHEEIDAAAFVASEAADVQEELYCEELDRRILIRLRGDPPLCLVYKALKDGYQPGEIAEEYGMNVRDVRNAQKRLHRAVLEVLDKSERNMVI